MTSPNKALEWIFVVSLLCYGLIGISRLLSPNETAKAGSDAPPTLSRVSVRIRFGLKDTRPTEWDGTISVSPGRVERLDGWRFAEEDAISDITSWTASTRRIWLWYWAEKNYAPEAKPMADNGIVAQLAEVSPSSLVEVNTIQGKFSFTLDQVPYGKRLPLLNSSVEVDRVPSPEQISFSREEQDFPAAASSADGSVWLAYVEFVHNAEYQRSLRELELPVAIHNRILREKPKSFDWLAAPPGGDQVFLMNYANRSWSKPIPVSRPGGDIYGCTISVDGQQRIWVIWSENRQENFDLYARSFKGGQFSNILRLTSSPGADIHPAAETDSSGHVWVAWQGFRDEKSAIVALRQEGDGFGQEMVIGAASANSWEPAIATSKSGKVAIAWDTYLKGDYDVYMRTAQADGRFGPPILVAGTLQFEARPSLVYDEDDRLWIAWEESGDRWGKDFGQYGTKGIGLFYSRNITTRVYVDKQPLRPAASLRETLPGPAGLRWGETQTAARDSHNLNAPQGSKPGGYVPMPLNSFPRLATDPEGRICLIFRTVWPRWQGELGTVNYMDVAAGNTWVEELVYYEKDHWVGPIYIPHSGNLLDNRPAIVGVPEGGIMLIYSSDHRPPNLGGYGPLSGPEGADERFNNDLFISVLDFGPTHSKPGLLSLSSAAEQPALPEERVASEREDIELCRSYRIEVGGRKLRLLRGEFHRHTDISADGGSDGALIDMWRYGLDVAGLDWMNNGDHDSGALREYTWWLIQKTTDVFHVGTSFFPLFSYERSVPYPEGHRNLVFARRGVRVLPQLATVSEDAPGHAPDTQMLYEYLRHFDGISAPHTPATSMGTDWRDNDPSVETMVEIYQGARSNYEMPGAPRGAPQSISDEKSRHGWRPKGFVSQALMKGYRLGFEASSDHRSTHMSYCNVWAETPTRRGIVDAMKLRHVYGSTDNIIADVRCGDHFMGDEFDTHNPPTLRIKLIGTAPFAKVHIIRDNVYVHSTGPKSRTVEFEWQDNSPVIGRASYYYVRGEQEDGNIVWVSPMWISYKKP